MGGKVPPRPRRCLFSGSLETRPASPNYSRPLFVAACQAVVLVFFFFSSFLLQPCSRGCFPPSLLPQGFSSMGKFPGGSGAGREGGDREGEERGQAVTEG